MEVLSTTAFAVLCLAVVCFAAENNVKHCKWY